MYRRVKRSSRKYKSFDVTRVAACQVTVNIDGVSSFFFFFFFFFLFWREKKYALLIGWNINQRWNGKVLLFETKWALNALRGQVNFGYERYHVLTHAGSSNKWSARMEHNGNTSFRQCAKSKTRRNRAKSIRPQFIYVMPVNNSDT